MLQTISITVTGKVQGVFYRQSTKEKAIAFGLTGEVSNMPDGSVQIIASGAKEQLDELIAWCHHGPSRAIVERVVVKEVSPQVFTKFSITRYSL